MSTVKPEIINAARSALSDLEKAHADLKSGCLVGDAKEAIKQAAAKASKGLNGVQVVLPIGTPETLDYKLYTALHFEEVTKVRSRSGLDTELSAIISCISGLITTAGLSECTEATNRLEQLESIINTELQATANSSINVGKALIEAREEFDKQQDFLLWASDKFSIKKSQAFNLMKVAKTFGEDERFNGVAMRVLNLLAGESDEVKGKAAELAAQGKLTTPELKAISGGKKAETKAPAEQPETAQESPPSHAVQEHSDSESAAPAVTGSQSEAIAALTRRIDKLLDENARLAAQIASAGKSKQSKQLPMLPHFKSGCFLTRLGLSATSFSNKDIRAAYRDITKHYTPETNKEAFELITEALESLTSKAKAA